LKALLFETWWFNEDLVVHGGEVKADALFTIKAEANMEAARTKRPCNVRDLFLSLLLLLTDCVEFMMKLVSR